MGRVLKAEPPAGEPGRLAGHGEQLAARREAEAVLAEARAEAERERAALQAEREALRRERAEADARFVGELEGEVIALALAVAGHVLAVAVEDPRAARESARRALGQAGGCRRLLLRCHPADEASLREPGALPRPDGPAPALVPDPAVGRGGVLLETEAGLVDARVEAQLERLERELGGAA